MKTLAGEFEYAEEIKKSRFIARATTCDSIDAALGFIASASIPDASHNCWAYRIAGDYRFNDDGEPASTAGRPILSAIEGHELDNSVVIVTRYFGGTKLGAGGLIRAYGGCASKCLDRAEILEVHPRCQVRLYIPFDQTGQLHHILTKYSASKIEEKFAENGTKLVVELEESVYTDFTRSLIDVSHGKIALDKPV